MNIEQKAEAYDKALKNMRKFRDALNNHEETDLWVLKKEIVTDIEYYFPELKESVDEQMWKLIKKYAHNNISDMVLNADHITRDQLESWLESKSDQRSTDNVDIKFKIGDWIISHYNHVAYIKSIDGKNYVLSCIDGNSERLSIDCINRNWRLWTIKDAKDGEVLVTDNGRPFIFKGCLDETHPNNPVAYCGIDCDNNFYIANNISWWTNENVYPATEEQRSFLFQKIHESGFEWDAEKKKLKKIKQNPTWGEEDEINFKRLILYLSCREKITLEVKNKYIDWLKSIKERHAWKPNDEQMDALQYVYRNLNPSPSDKLGCDSIKTLGLMFEQLKKLK